MKSAFEKQQNDPPLLCRDGQKRPQQNLLWVFKGNHQYKPPHISILAICDGTTRLLIRLLAYHAATNYCHFNLGGITQAKVKVM